MELMEYVQFLVSSYRVKLATASVSSASLPILSTIPTVGHCFSDDHGFGCCLPEPKLRWRNYDGEEGGDPC